MLKFTITFGLFLLLHGQCYGLNILINNDDGFGSSNIREFYRALRGAGHNAWIVAPAVDNSGQGGRLTFTTYANLTNTTEFGLVPAGAPSLGTDPNDNHIWYYNGTPAACTLVGLDYVLPNFADFDEPDLFVSGPNFGDNLGTNAYTGSGTIGATYSAVERSIPAIAFSASNSAQSYKEITNTTNQASRVAELSVQLVEQISKTTPAGERILPYGYGINVNYPPVNASCLHPPFVRSRFTGGSGTATAAFNASTGLISYGPNSYYGIVTQGANRCFNGACNITGETQVVRSCQSSVTIFTVDYDAPDNDETKEVVTKLNLQ